LSFNGFPCPTSIFLFFLSFSPFLIGLLGSIPALISLDDIAFYFSTNHRQWVCCQLSLWSTLSSKKPRGGN
jgi:hypothetical protein